jgi:hypothetical protein
LGRVEEANACAGLPSRNNSIVGTTSSRHVRPTPRNQDKW